jgi:hypothetical protein
VIACATTASASRRTSSRRSGTSSCRSTIARAHAQGPGHRPRARAGPRAAPRRHGRGAERGPRQGQHVHVRLPRAAREAADESARAARGAEAARRPRRARADRGRQHRRGGDARDDARDPRPADRQAQTAARSPWRRIQPEVVFMDIGCRAFGHEGGARIRKDLGHERSTWSRSAYGTRRIAASRVRRFDSHLVKPLDPPLAPSSGIAGRGGGRVL